MFSVTSAFEGGNGRIISIDGDRIILDADLRDTEGDWFFWCIKVMGAAGGTLHFEFPSSHRVGYFGAAVSYDLENWHWQHRECKSGDGRHFSYTFSDDENEVYLAHDMVYRPKRFLKFAESLGLAVKELCISEKGRSVPYIDTEKGDGVILLTARHHACESTGSYILEGVLDEMLKCLSDKYRVICVPFVDMDGVTDGDQGKNRSGHDHNRDYTRGEPSIYRSVAEIRRIADRAPLKYAFDFHSPWHWSGLNDTVFIPIKNKGMEEDIQHFSRFFEDSTDESTLPYSASGNVMPDDPKVSWNKSGTPGFSGYMAGAGAELSFSLETPYFKAGDTVFTPERAVSTGRAFARALLSYENRK